MKQAIAIEFGGQSIKAALVDKHGNLTSHNRITLNQESPPCKDAFARDFTALILTTQGGTRPSAVGIAHPNPCDSETLTFMLTHKPAYRHLNGHSLKPLILENTGLSEYRAIYDAGAAALGELWQGHIAEQGRFLLLTLGTGLGAAFMQDGFIVTGEEVEGIPESGELWDYLYMNTDFENTTGTTKAAISIYYTLGGEDPDVLAGDLKRLASIALDHGHAEIAQTTFAEFGRRLGAGLAPIVRVFRPEAIILSGNIAKAFDLFEPAATQALEAQLHGTSIATRFVPSDLIDQGGLLGAAFCAFHPDRPFRRSTTLPA